MREEIAITGLVVLGSTGVGFSCDGNILMAIRGASIGLLACVGVYMLFKLIEATSFSD